MYLLKNRNLFGLFLQECQHYCHLLIYYYQKETQPYTQPYIAINYLNLIQLLTHFSIIGLRQIFISIVYINIICFIVNFPFESFVWTLND